jgi:hypothetical protein
MIRQYRVTSLVSGETWANSAHFQDDGHFRRVLKQWNKPNTWWPNQYEALPASPAGAEANYDQSGETSLRETRARRLTARLKSPSRNRARP